MSAVETGDALLAMHPARRAQVVERWLEAVAVSDRCWIENHVDQLDRLGDQRAAVLAACVDVYGDAAHMSPSSMTAVREFARRVAGIYGTTVL